jgi:hypothetical protein
VPWRLYQLSATADLRDLASLMRRSRKLMGLGGVGFGVVMVVVEVVLVVVREGVARAGW